MVGDARLRLRAYSAAATGNKGAKRAIRAQGSRYPGNWAGWSCKVPWYRSGGHRINSGWSPRCGHSRCAPLGVGSERRGRRARGACHARAPTAHETQAEDCGSLLSVLEVASSRVFGGLQGWVDGWMGVQT